MNARRLLDRFTRRDAVIPAEVSAALRLRPSEVLAASVDRSGAHLVASKSMLYAVRAGAVELARPWHLVDTGRWDDETSTLTVTWVDRAPRSRWVIEDAHSLMPQVFRERTQSTVVLSEEVDLGDRRRARVVIRKDAGSGELLGQTILGDRARASDPEVQAATAAALARLREQVGLG